MLSSSAYSAYSQVSFGEVTPILENWRFHRGDPHDACAPEFDDTGWRSLDLPHDWSVEGPYNPNLASAMGYLPGGIGWYRKVLDIPLEKEGKRIYVYFEGVYRNGEVFINGKSLGIRPNGYISYLHDLTPHLKFGGENCLAVRVDHSASNDSRWYTGSGIYRNVYLIEANPVHIGLWGVHFTTPRVSREKAGIEVTTTVTNKSSESVNVKVVQQIFDDDAKLVATVGNDLILPAGETGVLRQELTIESPALWSLKTPNLYRLHTSLFQDDELLDATSTRVGIREFQFDAAKGLFLNGESLKAKGVCLHHDAGSLGAAVPREVWERRLRTLQSLGVNAIRTSHNPQAPLFYELCDELGFLVINEAFDEWEFPKKKWIEGWNVGTPGFQGHADFFAEWGETDLRDMILRDRNHPSVFMWSIGNEVDYPNDPYSHPILNEVGIQQQHQQGYLPGQPHAERLGEVARKLAAVVREYDSTRPITAGLAGPVMSNETGYPEALDVVGYNYTESRYARDRETYPERIFYGSENGHSMSAWKAVRDNEAIFGQFLWTGIDYLGESHRWPSRGFMTGMVDLAGFEKPKARFRQSLWTEEPMIFVGTYPKPANHNTPSIDADPVWNFGEGSVVCVVAYTNCGQAELLLNGKRVGGRRDYDDETGIIHWEIPFVEGCLEARAFRDGEEVARDRIETNGPAHAIEASAYDREISSARGVAQILIRIVDKIGRPVPDAGDKITVTTEGPVRLLGMEAGDPHDMGDYTGNSLRAFQGRMVVYLEALREGGEATVTLKAPTLKSAAVRILVR